MTPPSQRKAGLTVCAQNEVLNLTLMLLEGCNVMKAEGVGFELVDLFSSRCQ